MDLPPLTAPDSFPQLEKLRPILPGLRQRAMAHDLSGDWPSENLAALADIGAMRWAVPRRFGGDELPALQLHLLYEAIAAASLSTALVFSQRDSAVGMLEGSVDRAPNHPADRRTDHATERPLAIDLLTRLARGEFFTTIGIAQLTTSRQGGAPALRAVVTNDGYQLDGLIPWSTGAAKAQVIIAGAVRDDGRQILFALPPNLRGVSVQEPMPLVALRSSWTTSLECRAVMLPQRYVLRGPAEKVLGGRKNIVPIPQAFLATGLCRGGLALIAEHTSDRARAAGQRLAAQLDELLRLSDGPQDSANVAQAAPRLRGQCNDLALRITQAAVALYKGSALLNTHPAQRMAREAMFLLVWSCPNPVIDCTLDLLTT